MRVEEMSTERYTNQSPLEDAEGPTEQPLQLCLEASLRKNSWKRRL